MTSRFSTRIYGVGPVYFAVETKCTVPERISRAWITEVAEPYRTGHGWRVRLGHYAVQFGRCRRNPDVDNEDPSFAVHLGMRWLPYRPGGEHDYEPDTPDEGRDEGAGLDQVRPGEPEPVQRDGVVEGRDLPGVQPIRMGTSGERPADGSEDVNERWRRDYNTQATAQDRPGG